MKAVVVTQYQGIEIVYDEGSNQWVFTLRGRERAASSLGSAKLIIDKPAPKDKKPFERVRVYLGARYGRFGEYKEGEVTSIAAPGPWQNSSKEVWTTVDGERTKRDARNCYPVNATNTRIVGLIRHAGQTVAKLQAEMERLVQLLEPLNIEKE